ncbi:martik [Haematobia irritans]|uniref:martik n=1 Tax=Haematobia irritans TaxID=7368 RepID=UPI003F5017F3
MLLPQQHSNVNLISIIESNNSGLEVKPIFKKMPQHNPINKLLSTAATGNGVIGDVDALLTPIAKQDLLNPNGSNSFKERNERNLWRNDEVMEMLFIMQQINALDKLNDKTVKSENVFKDVEIIMHKNGFVKKSHVQIWTKWKFLKSTYMTSRRNGVIPRMIPQEIYNILHQMISNYYQGLNESGNSTTGSMDGDSSSHAAVTGNMSTSGREDTDNNSTAVAKLELSDSKLPLEVQMSLVKNEPSDTGYDAIENKVEVSNKQIPNEMLEKSTPINKQSNVQGKQPKKTLEIPYRGRGRPPKNLSMVSSTPNGRQPSPATTRLSVQMPPLRVAPFASKTANTTNALAASRPPPPLTMPPTSRPIRIANLSALNDPLMKNCAAAKFSQPKLMPKPTAPPQQQQQQQVNVNTSHSMRLPKDVQSNRQSSTPSPSYPKLKQVPMRKTPYSLRPDRVIPDLDESFSPPNTPNRYEDVPSTSGHMFLQENGNIYQNGINRKRRLDWPPPPPNQGVPTKLRKIPSDYVGDPTPPPMATKHTHKSDIGYGKLLQSVIVDFSTTLRKVQTQMMKEFFNKQQELMQREHEFQMQQDRLIMETFQIQTFEIMRSVKELVENVTVQRREEENKEANMEGTPQGYHKDRRESQDGENQHQDHNDIDGGDMDYGDGEAEDEHNDPELENIMYSEEGMQQEHHAEHEINGHDNGETETREDHSEELNQHQDQDREAEDTPQTHEQENLPQQLQLHDEQSLSGASDDDDDEDDDDDDEDDSTSSDSSNDNEEVDNGPTLMNGNDDLNALQMPQLTDEEDDDE